ncbi:MAG: mannitol dehydrogenase family protein [Hamadaea sp.]|uniref:mannitol dehydrogenase family protein n=1 Tax=Hamadaea sp. TaxID=2024425 RepID=UPI0018183197|nr:mannitol dehydrogenase family protein [Hamadaea sp.]NUT23769.1 mannitol dehydrogenase family protein [Hamadaea sp.]
MARLTKQSLAGVPAEARPRIETPGLGIVHLGIGAFYRAHQAVYIEDAIAEGGGDWAVAAVAPSSTTIVDALRAQDGLFSVASLSAAGARTRVIASIGTVLHAPSERSTVTDLLADPAIRVVTLTVTEKAYQPGSAMVKLLVDGIRARIAAGAPPLAVVSCDNLPSNGSRLRALVAEAVDLPESVTFPKTTVDRIVPASTAETYALVRNALGVDDLAAVETEPYKQWVIEDAFPGGRPAWDRAGAVLTDDVAPWEQLKLRTLNGVHSTVAYLGALAGYETIADALVMPGLTDVLRRFIADEIAPSFAPPPGVSVMAYGDEVLERFENPAIRHRTIQVAMDGSQKLPYRVLRTVLDLRARGLSPRFGALVVAAWMRFAEGTADDGTQLPLNDPMAAQIQARLAAGDDVVDQLLSLTEIFPESLTSDEEFRSLVREWHRALSTHGVRATVAGVS